MDIMRHVAKIANTDQRCVVVFMQLPGKEDHALVVPTDNLQPRLEQAIMGVLKTPEGQQEENFANVLSRHLMPDTGKSILETLHVMGKLVPVNVNNVLMLPQPNRPVKLSFILEQLGRLSHLQSDINKNEVEKFNPHTHNRQSEINENARSIARGLLIEAEMLEADAKKKREAAYSKDPSLRSQQKQYFENTVKSDIVDAQQYVPEVIQPVEGMYLPEIVQPVEGMQVVEGIQTRQQSNLEERLFAIEELVKTLVTSKVETTETKKPVTKHAFNKKKEVNL
jgi:hypothetical protein